MGVENIVAGDGIGIAVTGMLVVVAGLVLISTFIAVLPRAFAWAGRVKARRERRGRSSDGAVEERTASSGMDPDLLAAIGFVLEAERERELSQDRQRITIREDDDQGVWTAIGKMRTLSTRL